MGAEVRIARAGAWNVMEVDSATICVYETTRVYPPSLKEHGKSGHMKRRYVMVTRCEAAVMVKRA